MRHVFKDPPKFPTINHSTHSYPRVIMYSELLQTILNDALR